MNITSIISNIAMIGNAIATIAVLLKGQSNMFQMNCNPAYGTPMVTAQTQNVPCNIYQQPQPINYQNNYGYGYGYAQPEPAQPYQVNPCMTNSAPVNQGYPAGPHTQSYYNNQYCAPVWVIDPCRYNPQYQSGYANHYDNNIQFDYSYGIEQNPYVYGYNYNVYNYQSRRSFDNYINNPNPYEYNWPYQEQGSFNPMNNNIESFHRDNMMNIQQPISPWSKQSTTRRSIQNWNQNFPNIALPNDMWVQYDPYGRPENINAYRFRSRL